MPSSVEMDINSVYEEALQSQHRYLVMKGGGGSGKSVFAAQKIALRCLTEPGHKFLCLRKVGATIKDSVFALFIQLIYDMDLADKVRVHYTDRRFIFPNGSQILTSGIDDPEKVKSIVGITGLWLEEATEFDERDFDQLELRVRGETDYYKQFILTFNPVDEGHWLKKRFYDKPDPDVLTVHSTYLDNPFLDDEYIKLLTVRMKRNENMYRIYTLGEWGKPKTGFEFYKNFDFKQHTGHLKYNPDLPLHLAFDFNVNPGMHALVIQIEGQRINVIDEIKTTNPHNTTKGVCREFMSRANYKHHRAGLFIYGDPSGKQEDTRSEKGYNDFRIIEMELAEYRPQLRVLSKHPAVAVRGQFINSCFFENFDGIEIAFDVGCKGTIEDFSYLKETADGSKLKERVKDPDSGISYEKYGHYSDGFDYMICYAFSSSFDKFQKGDIKQAFILGESRANNKF